MARRFWLEIVFLFSFKTNVYQTVCALEYSFHSFCTQSPSNKERNAFYLSALNKENNASSFLGHGGKKPDILHEASRQVKKRRGCYLQFI